uniref:(California timema) hypothetical protein n=1 Tax=Timema californicum TaxID=61474 RepID=A0A7R9P8K3_TIMCA|nr:unnamed protein product [Timema californicum]
MESNQPVLTSLFFAYGLLSDGTEGGLKTTAQAKVGSVTCCSPPCHMLVMKGRTRFAPVSRREALCLGTWQPTQFGDGTLRIK